MVVKIGVVHHTTRDITGLVKATKAAVVSTDDGTLGAGWNHRAVWSSLLETVGRASHLVVLEDDAVPVQGFLSQLDRALEVAPSPIVSLYLGREWPPHWQHSINLALQDADKTDAAWLVCDELLHGVGVAVQTDLVADMLENSNQRLPIDESISSWAMTNHHLVSYTTPSLVEHADLPTLVNHFDGEPRPAGRVAWRTGARRKWTGEAVELLPQPNVTVRSA